MSLPCPDFPDFPIPNEPSNRILLFLSDLYVLFLLISYPDLPRGLILVGLSLHIFLASLASSHCNLGWHISSFLNFPAHLGVLYILSLAILFLFIYLRSCAILGISDAVMI